MPWLLGLASNLALAHPARPNRPSDWARAYTSKFDYLLAQLQTFYIIFDEESLPHAEGKIKLFTLIVSLE